MKHVHECFRDGVCKITTKPAGTGGNNLTAAQIAQNPILDPGHVKNVLIYDKPDDFSRNSGTLSTGNAQSGSCRERILI